MKICHLTSVHNEEDIRIFIKECSSAAKENFELHLIAPFDGDYEKNNVRLHGIKKLYSNRLQRMTKLSKDIYKKAISINADVYHFHDPELIPLGLKLKRLGKKVIYDVHEDTPRAILSKYWIPSILRKTVSFIFERYENYASKKFDYIISATPFIAHRFLKFKKECANINNYPFLKELKQDGESINIKKEQVCYIGGITPMRGIPNIINAVEATGATLSIAGPISPKLSKDELLNRKQIKYKGEISRLEVMKLLNTSLAGLVLFLPEPNHINSQPNKMFEYMSSGLCVIASDFPLWKEIIEGHNCGICVDPTNVDSIAVAIQWVLDNPDKASEMGENGRKAVEEKYNWETESKKLIELYNKLESEIHYDKESKNA